MILDASALFVIPSFVLVQFFLYYFFENFTIIIFILHVYYPAFLFDTTGAFFLEHFHLVLPISYFVIRDCVG